MIVWGWRGGPVTAVRDAFGSALRDRGFVEATEPAGAALVVRVGVDGDGDGAVVQSTGTGGLTIARAIARRVGRDGTFCELDLGGGPPRAQAMSIGPGGEPGGARDLDAEAREIVSAYGDDKPLGLDAAHAVMSTLLGASPREVARLAFRRGRTSRTQALVEAVRAGASWERTELGGRVAIRVRGVDATRISFLEPEELADLERELSA